LTISELNWYSSLKEELKKYSIPVDDISEFARLVNNIRQHSGYDVDKVINEFWDLEQLHTNRKALLREVTSLENRAENLKGQLSGLEAIVNIRNQAISAYDSLKNMGFGLKELNFLYDTIKEIAYENNIPPTKAVRKFLSDVEEQYNKKIGFEEKLEKMRKEHANLKAQNLLHPLIGPALSKLITRGLSEQDIINIAAAIEKYAAGGANTSSPAGSSSTDKQPQLLSDLEKYGGLKSTIERLTQQENTLT
jgi:DNA repair exonuclease SbcCD ATPase subunit